MRIFVAFNMFEKNGYFIKVIEECQKLFFILDSELCSDVEDLNNSKGAEHLLSLQKYK